MTANTRIPFRNRPSSRPAGRDDRRREVSVSPQHRALDTVAATIERCIAVLSDARLDETAMLLSIARLDLLARLNGVSEREIEFIRSLRSDKEESRPAH